MCRKTYLRYLQESEELYKRYREIARYESLSVTKDLIPIVLGHLSDSHDSLPKWSEEVLLEIRNLK